MRSQRSIIEIHSLNRTVLINEKSMWNKGASNYREDIIRFIPKMTTHPRAERLGNCQGHSSLDAPSELNPPQRIPSPLFVALLVPQAEG